VCNKDKIQSHCFALSSKKYLPRHAERLRKVDPFARVIRDALIDVYFHDVTGARYTTHGNLFSSSIINRYGTQQNANKANEIADDRHR
jgi:hypothetical protein